MTPLQIKLCGFTRPDDARIAVLYAGQGQYEKARQALEMAIRTHPSYATAHENLGDVYAKLASQAYDKALSLDGPIPRDRVADQILRETLLTVSSDWPFMVSKDSAADYARYRAHLHAHATREIAGALASGRRDTAQRLAEGWNRADGLFGALDARRLPR